MFRIELIFVYKNIENFLKVLLDRSYKTKEKKQ